MLNKESNSFIFIFSAVMVIAVGILLTVTNEFTKPSYESSVRKEKKQNILLAATGESSETLTRDVADVRFDEEIVEMYAFTADGVLKMSGREVFDIDLAAEQKKKGADAESALYPVYVHRKDGKTRYVIAMQGVGLWGPVWGYLAVDDDLKTVANAVFDHKSETPGLGAEIATDAFQKQFRSSEGSVKYIQGESGFLHVVKPGTVPATSSEYNYVVEGISGGTITSNGVSAMMVKFLEAFTNFANQNLVSGSQAKQSEPVTDANLTAELPLEVLETESTN